MKNTAQDTLSELERLGSARGGGGLNLMVRETADHTNVYLYTHLNKRIGKLHPKNAEATVKRFQKQGIELFLHPRTPEQIAEYKKTDTYKRLHKKHLDTRALRHKQSEGKGLDKMAKMIATEVGSAVAGELNKGKRASKKNDDSK